MASVARQPAAATSMMARVDRLDLVLSYLEELHHHHHYLHRGSNMSAAADSSSPSSSNTPSAGSSSPRGSWRRACRPAKEVLEEAHAKGSLVDRIAFLEDRVLKMEEGGMEITQETERPPMNDQRKEKVRDGNKKKKQRLKSLVKSCVRAGSLKTTDY